MDWTPRRGGGGKGGFGLILTTDFILYLCGGDTDLRLNRSLDLYIDSFYMQGDGEKRLYRQLLPHKNSQQVSLQKRT